MTIPKKKSKVNRSRASKKGWATRRKNDPSLAKAWRAKKAKEKARFAQDHRTTEEDIIEKEVQRRVKLELKKHEKALAKKGAAIVEKLRSKLVAETVEQVLIDAPPGFVETDFSKIRTRMDIADLSGDPSLEAGILADEFNYEIRDIWTIYYGSDPTD